MNLMMFWQAIRWACGRRTQRRPHQVGALKQAPRTRIFRRRSGQPEKTRMLDSHPVSTPAIAQVFPVCSVTLFVPDMFWPHGGAAPILPPLPALRGLIGRGDASNEPCEDESAWLCTQFGIARQTDWPVAPVCLSGEGTDPGANYWLLADPVHLRLQRDGLILLPPDALTITNDEAQALCASLNIHFAAEGFHFVAPQAQHWYLTRARRARIRTRALARVAGRDINHLLPEGEDGLEWHRIGNEIQMLLHAHPINAQREQRGALAINSLWCSGGGTLPPVRTAFQSVIGSSALARGLAKIAQIDFTAAQQGFASTRGGQVLVELREVATAAMRLDTTAWPAAFDDLERRWFEPVAHALKMGRLRELDIVTVANQREYRWSVKRRHRYRWWRRAASLNIPQ